MRKRITLLFASVLLLCLACEKESDPQETAQPNESEQTFQLVTKKWEFPNSTEYKSIELTKDTVYFIEIPTLKSTSNANVISGKYLISSDGKIITLIGFGKLEIGTVRDENISLKLIKDGATSGTELLGVVDVVVSNPLVGTTWITGTLKEEGYSDFYLKMKFVSASYLQVWDCYYNGSSELNTSSVYTYSDISAMIKGNILTVSPMPGVTRVYKKMEATTLAFDHDLLMNFWEMVSYEENGVVTTIPNSTKFYEYVKFIDSKHQVGFRSVVNEPVEVDTALWKINVDEITAGYEEDGTDPGETFTFIKVTPDTMVLLYEGRAKVTYIASKYPMLMSKTWSMYSVTTNNQTTKIPNANLNYEYWRLYDVGRGVVERSVPNLPLEVDSGYCSINGDQMRSGYELDGKDPGDLVRIVFLSSDTFKIETLDKATLITFVAKP